MQRRLIKNTERGFSMLEILVTLIIILLGVLGMAGMQMLAINNTHIARTQSLAAILTSSLAAEMQANQPYWSSSTSTASSTISGVNSAAADGWTNTVLGDDALNGLATDCEDDACTPNAMAAYDLKTWGNNVATLLPAGTGQVTCTRTTPNVCAISVTWNENNVALHNNQTAAATSDSDLATGQIRSQTYQTFVNIN